MGKFNFSAFPVKTEFQEFLKVLDTGFRRYDNNRILSDTSSYGNLKTSSFTAV